MDWSSQCDMLGGLVKVAAVAASSAVVLPYIAALICNLAYGWPQVPNRYRRAFNPRKVYALNLCIIQSLILSVRYATLYVQWKSYYKMAGAPDVIKDKVYGRRSKKLDLYIPKKNGSGDKGPHPVLVFGYGGAWGSGDKKMYGLLCSAVANKLGVIVCCPNHSTYPQGYVDDMVQDMVDCLSWLHQNVQQYNGNKEKIILLGHSSGAHLSTMTMLELFRNELPPTNETGSQSTSPGSLQFRERHFTGNSDNEDRQSSGSSGSFQVLDGQNGNGVQSNDTDKMSLSTSRFEVLETQKSETEMSEGSMLESEIQDLTQSEISGIRYRGTSPDTSQSAPYVEGATGGDKSEMTDERSEDDNSVVTVGQGEGELIPSLTVTEPSMTELRKSVRAIIGLAGVYHIGDHFEHESSRGVEDISTMAKAMRGPENFDRFSPTHIVSTITTAPSFPKIIILHGTEDHVVPLTSASRFVDELKRIGADVKLRIIPNCDHYEICLDLMKPSMHFHRTVMTVLEDTANNVFS
ncbi:uncharacterized protein LOC123564406 isoform X2 [Mercenaria mercenaria]|uniref:uncharacterized protein LOC123564406 isoform X2 n=1 Tax=Mercenaria mercenaria TaxID=6596 RepID=UPI00234E844C|nr:uncharacterized protein LOC123564406 isoform X2 [Mercenaria mercenaria]